MSFFKKIVVIVIVFASFISCGNQKNFDIPTEIETTSTNPRIVFINYAFQKKANGALDINLINKIIKEGTLKKNSDLPLEDTGFLMVQLDANNNPIVKKNLENPSSKIVEYVKDNGEFGKKTIEITEGEFSIRTQLADNAAYINIFSQDKNQKNYKLLIQTKIE